MNTVLLEDRLRGLLADGAPIDPERRDRALEAVSVAFRSRATRPRRAVRWRRPAVVLGAAVVIASSVTAFAAILGNESIPRPDRANPIAEEIISDHLLTLAPAVDDPNTLCFSTENPAGGVGSVCSPKTRILKEGTGTVATDQRTGIATATGYVPPGSVTTVALGGQRVSVSPAGFYLIRGDADGTLTFSRDGAVVRQEHLGQSPPVPSPAAG